LTARLVLQHYSQQELTRILFEYGEEPKARLLARSIVKDRKIKKLPLESTVKLAFYIKNILAYPHSRIHPATRTFQALRIEVNQELESIKNLFKDIPLLVNQFARVAFISFHSLEDRLVKQTLRSWQKGKIFKEQNLCKKEDHIPLHFKLHVEENQSKGFGKETPRGGVATSPLECQNNPRARSARLRCFEFLENP
jgi:16S rRNA (cytosine1402-N4)-methyltransferase